MCFSATSMPEPAKIPKAERQDVAMLAAVDADRRRRASSGGFSSTLLTPMGAKAPTTTGPKTLLGA